MPNVKFLRGTQTNLSKYLVGGDTAAIEGAFYLTSDTNRLYVGKDVGSGSIKAVPVNQGVITVADIEHLPSTGVSQGQFYYAEAENVLCVRSGHVSGNAATDRWVQINPQTKLTNNNANISVGTTTGGYTVSDSVQDSLGNTSSGHFDLIAGDNVTLSASGNAITISAANSIDTTYDLSASDNKIVLSSSNTNDSDDEVTIAGSGKASVSTSGNTITVNVPVATTTVGAAFDSSGKLDISVTDSHASTGASANVTPKIKLGTNETEYKFVSGTATLPVYTKTEVDTAITNAKAQIDSMTYKGTVDSSDAATKIGTAGATTNTYAGNVGDTYKASGGFTAGGITAKTGDLIIAKGEDGSVTWEVVPSGDDQTITGAVDATNKLMSISDQSGVLGGIQIANGNHITATGSVNGKVNTITVGQSADYTAQNVSGTNSDVTQSARNTAEFEAITAIQTDTYGNVVDGSIQKKKITVTDTHNKIDSVVVSTSDNSNNVATITTNIADHDNNPTVSGAFTLETTGSIAITAPTPAQGSTTGRVNIDIVWGTF